MDGLGWDGSDSLPVWNSHPNDAEDSFLISYSNSSIYGDKKNLPEDIFINPIQQLQGAQPSHVNPDSDVVSEMVPQPIPELDSINVASNFNMLRSANGGNGLTQGWCSSSPLLNRSAYGLSSSNASVSDIGMAVHSQVINGLRYGNAGATTTTTSSLESLDCLLSVTNSNTDPSVEDDGISMIFSDCKSLWNFVAVSSGESENNGSNTGSKGFSCLVNELDETVSHSSSDQYINNIKQLETKSASSKRGINDDQSEFKVGLNCGYFNLLHTDSSGFKLIPENPPKAKKPRSEKVVPSSTDINFQQPSSSSVSSSIDEPDPEAIAQMKEMIYRAAAFRPVNLGMEVREKPKRKNLRISTDPQTVAARQRRERISERIRALQRLVPGGNKMDTASMLDEAANYLKFLRSQVKALENLGQPMTAFNSLPLNQ